MSTCPHYVCTACCIQDTTTGGSPEPALSQLHQSVRNLSATVNTLLSRRGNTALPGIPTESPTQLRTMIRAESYEVAEREKRKLSLIIRGILGPSQQQLTDQEYLEAFRTLAGHLIGDRNFIITRLDRISLTMSRVTLDNPVTRSLLNAASLLRNSSCSNIYSEGSNCRPTVNNGFYREKYLGFLPPT